MIPNAKTPAPWNYVGGGVVKDASGRLVAYLAGRLNDPEITDRVGCQIAAAPELYEALRVLLADHVNLIRSGDCGSWDAEEDGAVIEARAALAKALGK